MGNRIILYVGRIGMPNDAAGIRIYNIAKVLRDIGYNTDFICDREAHTKNEMITEFDGFKYYFIEPSRKKSMIQSAKNAYELVFAKKIFARVKEYCRVRKPFAIILYNDLYSLTKQLIEYCKKNDIKLIADVTEWYEKRDSRKIGDLLVPYFTDKRIRKLDKDVNNIISISPYFHKYYSNLGCNTIFIPPIFDIPTDIEIKKYNYYDNYVLNLVYAGFPAYEDILSSILEAIKAINSDRICYRIDLVGVDTDYLKKIWQDIDFENFAIFAHGKLPHKDTIEVIRKADFGILFRYDKRYAKAGFSTKFAECMAYGVPMICNTVGGADRMIDHLVDGVIIDNYKTDTIISILMNLLKLDQLKVLEIKMNAYTKAQLLFNGANYKKTFSDFLACNKGGK